MFEGDCCGVLLIYGFIGMLMEMCLFVKGLNNVGFIVYGMQLVGYCGDIEDLFVIGWCDWYVSVEVVVDKFLQYVDYLFVGGLLMGVLFLFKFVVECLQQVVGVGVYGVIFCYDGWSILWMVKLLFLLLLVKKFGLGCYCVFEEQYFYGLCDECLCNQVEVVMCLGDSIVVGLFGNLWYLLVDLYQFFIYVCGLLFWVILFCLVVYVSEDDVVSV